jgi:hypothetical protein
MTRKKRQWKVQGMLPGFFVCFVCFVVYLLELLSRGSVVVGEQLQDEYRIGGLDRGHADDNRMSRRGHNLGGQ